MKIPKVRNSNDKVPPSPPKSVTAELLRRGYVQGGPWLRTGWNRMDHSFQPLWLCYFANPEVTSARHLIVLVSHVEGTYIVETLVRKELFNVDDAKRKGKK